MKYTGRPVLKYPVPDYEMDMSSVSQSGIKTLYEMWQTAEDRFAIRDAMKRLTRNAECRKRAKCA